MGDEVVTIPQISLEGYRSTIGYLLYGNVISSPNDGTAYTAGERIEMLFLLDEVLNDREIMSVPFWLGDGTHNRREATLVQNYLTDGNFQVFIFAYTVQPGDADADGIYIPAQSVGRQRNR